MAWWHREHVSYTVNELIVATELLANELWNRLKGLIHNKNIISSSVQNVDRIWLLVHQFFLDPPPLSTCLTTKHGWPLRNDMWTVFCTAATFPMHQEQRYRSFALSHWYNTSVANKPDVISCSHFKLTTQGTDITYLILWNITQLFNNKRYCVYVNSLQWKCHFDEIFITGSIGRCQDDNILCSQWWKLHQNGDISVSVLTC